MAFDQDKANAICEAIAAGASLRKAAKAQGIDPSTVLKWEDANPDFAQQYARARADGYKLLADEIIEISDDSSRDIIETEHGPKTDAEVVARSRLRVDSRKWMLSKMLPKIYGERTTLAGDPDAPLNPRPLEGVPTADLVAALERLGLKA
jgi:hypothetical protein